MKIDDAVTNHKWRIPPPPGHIGRRKASTKLYSKLFHDQHEYIFRQCWDSKTGLNAQKWYDMTKAHLEDFLNPKNAANHKYLKDVDPDYASMIIEDIYSNMKKRWPNLRK